MFEDEQVRAGEQGAVDWRSSLCEGITWEPRSEKWGISVSGKEVT